MGNNRCWELDFGLLAMFSFGEGRGHGLGVLGGVGREKACWLVGKNFAVMGVVIRSGAVVCEIDGVLVLRRKREEMR